MGGDRVSAEMKSSNPGVKDGNLDRSTNGNSLESRSHSSVDGALIYIFDTINLGGLSELRVNIRHLLPHN